jgi:hypothetical protein
VARIRGLTISQVLPVSVAAGPKPEEPVGEAPVPEEPATQDAASEQPGEEK